MWRALNLSLIRPVYIWTRSVYPPPKTWASSRETTSHHGSERQQAYCYQVRIMCFIALCKSDFFFFLMTSMTVSLLTFKDLGGGGGGKSLCLPSANNLVLAVGKTLRTSWVLSYFCMNSYDRVAAQHLTLDGPCKSAWDPHKRAHEVIEL